MNCKNCDNNKLSSDAKFCNKCGKPVEIEKKEKIEIKGISGWFSLFLFSLVVWVVLNFIAGIGDVSSILKTTELAKTWLYGLVFLDILYYGGLIGFTAYTIFSFLKLKSNAVSLGKMCLILIFSDTLISILFSVFTGESISMVETSYLGGSQIIFRNLVYSVIWFLYLSLSKRVNNTFPKETRKTTRLDKVLFFVIMATFLVISLLGFIGSAIPDESTGQQVINNSSSTTELIVETVKEVKAGMTLPNQIDEATTLVDITAEPTAIRYHYILSGIDSSKLTNDYLKNYLILSICKNNDTKNLLNQGVDMEYSYIDKDTQQTFFTSLTKEDCLTN